MGNQAIGSPLEAAVRKSVEELTPGERALLIRRYSQLTPEHRAKFNSLVTQPRMEPEEEAKTPETTAPDSNEGTPSTPETSPEAPTEPSEEGSAPETPSDSAPTPSGAPVEGERAVGQATKPEGTPEDTSDDDDADGEEDEDEEDEEAAA